MLRTSLLVLAAASVVLNSHAAPLYAGKVVSYDPGVGYSASFQSTTINACRGCSVTVGVFSTTAYTMEVDVWDGLAQAAGVWVARDLAALEWLNLSIDFKRKGN